jgi:outer membrane murein-binding lipoprotein Lpp
MQKRLVFLVVLTSLLLFVSGCGDSDKLKSENAALSTKVQQLEKELAEIKNSPQMRYAKAAELEKNNLDAAIGEYSTLINQYPNSEEAKNAKIRVAKLEQIKKDEQEKAEAKKREYEESIKPPLTLIEAQVTLNAIDNPEARVIVQNTSRKTVDAFTVGIYCYDRYGSPVNHYAYKNNRYGGLSQVTISPGQTTGYNYRWTLHGHENTAKIKVVLEKVHMTDDTVWTPQAGREISVEGVLIN